MENGLLISEQQMKKLYALNEETTEYIKPHKLNAIVWAKQNGIVNGVTENEFSPDENITRE